MKHVKFTVCFLQDPEGVLVWFKLWTIMHSVNDPAIATKRGGLLVDTNKRVITECERVTLAFEW